jgi:hypothetical protein
MNGEGNEWSKSVPTPSSYMYIKLNRLSTAGSGWHQTAIGRNGRLILPWISMPPGVI